MTVTHAYRPQDLEPYVVTRRDDTTEAVSRMLATYAPSPFDHVLSVDELGAPNLDPDAHHLIDCENKP